ncbi:MAG TPA: type II CAAX endopeptidase family protein [Candidatus Hydrogenedens sp.]|nr:CPBP family intramembrane metalloprotease [Candidatus Hydrogenedens sp.]HOK09469.1 type II CAAX endopeptidase family protein [Candidatus Hydrogenedens sp.]HOL18940.1 type II CAAX endopeptidase family protein [Candidatus Hydrogenedens sp.]HPP59008.1 type II CAAX endopeptidase family protein [Candidatus Hydrogenedens sp.]
MNPKYLLIIFVIYILLEFTRNLFKKNFFSSLTKMCQFVLLICSIIYLAIIGILPRNLFNISSWIIGLILGHIVYTIGFFITIGFNELVKNQFLSIQKILRFSVLSPIILSRTMTIALTEEIIYRASLQTILINVTAKPILSVFIISIAFTLVHEHVFVNNIRQNIEFVVFSIFLGFAYYLTSDLGLVTIIHFIRNMESNYLEYQEKLIEEPDEERCLTELEQSLFSPNGVKECKANN